MALKRNKLLDALDALREQIKNDEYNKTGKIPVVCSDKVLKEIASKKPLKKSDFLAISGVGNKFIDHYALQFLNVIKQFQNESAKEVKVSKEAFKVLDHYKDRLTNISRRNPNLYMSKISKKFNFDMSLLNMNEKIIDFLINKRISKFKVEFDESGYGEELLRHLTNIYRETNKALKENGSYDLYIGYPYLEGVFKRDNFAIRAPLLYFPVTITRNKRDLYIEKNRDKDIKYNRDLLLAISKMENNEIDAKTTSVYDFSNRSLRDIVLPFYTKNGYVIKEKDTKFAFEKYENILKENFVKRKKGIFHVREYITIGRYKLYSSMIQKDMSLILDSSKYNELLEGLIEETNLYADEKEVNFNIDKTKVDETNLTYINEINYSQEKVLELVNNNSKLVIWGPPGTGKSQTITSLIAQGVLKGENVLLISEKKAALDVIYSRLKNASKYAMFIDDVENKQDFYEKLKQFIDPIPPYRTLNNDIYKLEEEIKEIIEALDNSLDLLYGSSIQDIPINELYKRYVVDKDIKAHLTPKRVHIMFKDTFKKLDFKELHEIEDKFKNKKSLHDYLNFKNIIDKYPLLNQLETKITRSNIIEFEEFSKRFDRIRNKLKSKWWFTKRKVKKAFYQNNKDKIDFIFPKKKLIRQYFNLLFNDHTLHDYIVDNIKHLNKFKTKHYMLSNNEIKYLEMLNNNSYIKDVEDIFKEHNYLFDAFYTGYLEDFKTKNQKYLYILDKYTEKLNELNILIEEKKQVTIESFEMELYQNALNFSNSKRIIDIKRMLDSQRRISIRAFIDTFLVELMNNVKVWMMTPEALSAVMPLVYGMFDLVIFDEASQMFVEKGIPAIYRAKKVIIAGDTKQLRPSSLGMGRVTLDDEFYEEDVIRDASIDAKSLLDLARYKYDETILNYHYRAQYEELIAFSNYAFYDAKLIVSPNQKQSIKPPIEYVYVEDGIFDNRSNDKEALEVVKVIKKIFRERKNNETIGVITFNSAQRDLIENYIDDELFKKTRYQKEFELELFRNDDGEDKSLFIKNIENVQGDERDIIIFSMGYARNPDGFIRRQFGWLNNDGGQNRLNVAISRAKKKIYFVSSLYPEELKVDDLKSTGPKLLKDYMRYCYYISNNKKDLASEVLNNIYSSESYTQEIILNDMVKDIKSRLEKGRHNVKTSIGIGKYSINLAVYDDELKEYTLGIICDISSNNYDARSELYHQEKYLQARKWNTYRVFASNWYIDPNREMRNIRELLKK